jgi:hypothetical protein
MISAASSLWRLSVYLCQGNQGCSEGFSLSKICLAAITSQLALVDLKALHLHINGNADHNPSKYKPSVFYSLFMDRTKWQSAVSMMSLFAEVCYNSFKSFSQLTD